MISSCGDTMKFLVKVYHPEKSRFLRKIIGYHGSTYEVDTIEALYDICKWAAEKGFEARVTKFVDP